jgi:hypothetical protein
MFSPSSLEGAGVFPRILEIGVLARHALSDGAHGEVAAVFARSAYLVIAGHWICIGPPAIGAGPLNVLCAAVPWRHGAALAVGDPVAVRGTSLSIGSSWRLSFAAATVWHPPAPPKSFDPARGLAALDAAIAGRLPAEGLGFILRGDPVLPRTPLATVAAAPVGALCALISAAAGGSPLRIDVDAVAPLLGSGPGLTPSGDDFVGGVLIALALVGLSDLRDRIWSAFAPRVTAATNRISGAHLAAAARGFGHAALHAILDDILAGRDGGMADHRRAIDAIGHTSGWDALAGAVTVLRQVLLRRAACGCQGDQCRNFTQSPEQARRDSSDSTYTAMCCGP